MTKDEYIMRQLEYLEKRNAWLEEQLVNITSDKNTADKELIEDLSSQLNRKRNELMNLQQNIKCLKRYLIPVKIENINGISYVAFPANNKYAQDIFSEEFTRQTGAVVEIKPLRIVNISATSGKGKL